jgi:hypothetical protein
VDVVISHRRATFLEELKGSAIVVMVMLSVVAVILRGAFTQTSPCPCGHQSCLGALPDRLCLKLCSSSKYVKHQPPIRGGRINLRSGPCKDFQSDLALMQRIDQFYQALTVTTREHKPLCPRTSPLRAQILALGRMA